MSNQRVPAPACWPFYLADIALLAAAFWIVNHYQPPLPPWALAGAVACLAVAAWLGVMPHREHYQAILRFAESDELTDVVRQINRIDDAATGIENATAQWQGIQEHSTKSITAAREIGDRMAAEARAFAEFMQKANDQEKATLRLELEKLRRAEGQSLQILVHLLDHVYALQQAGARSGQPNLEAQLTRFQGACRDVVRRIGLLPFDAEPGEAFNGDRHQLPDGQPAPEPGASVGQTLATGYNFQGQMLRRALVAMRSEAPPAAAPLPEPASLDGTPKPEPESHKEPTDGSMPRVEQPVADAPPVLDENAQRSPTPPTHGELFQLDS